VEWFILKIKRARWRSWFTSTRDCFAARVQVADKLILLVEDLDAASIHSTVAEATS